MSRPVFPAYIAAFVLGMREALASRGEILTNIVCYSTLLVLFNSVFAAMPLHELGVPGLTQSRMLWYFAITECVIVASSGMALFGSQIRAGLLSTMMQRPCSVFGFVLAKLFGQHIVHMLILLGFALVALPVCLDAPWAFPAVFLPLLAGFILAGLLLFALATCMIGALEVLGPYSRPVSMIIGKFLFVFGGLFFPVSFFPPLAQHMAELTPFPSIIFVPGSLALMPDADMIWHGVRMQLFWIVSGTILAWWVQRWMLHRVLEQGE